MRNPGSRQVLFYSALQVPLFCLRNVSHIIHSGARESQQKADEESQDGEGHQADIAWGSLGLDVAQRSGHRLAVHQSFGPWLMSMSQCLSRSVLISLAV